MVHDNSSLLVVNLCIYPGIPNEVDNPFLALILAQTKASGKIPDYTLVLSV